MPVCQSTAAVKRKAKQSMKIKKKIIGRKPVKHRSEPAKHHPKPAKPARGQKNSGNVCNMGKITINPFFNFVRTIRQTRCGDQQQSVVHDAAVLWRGMTQEQKRQYTRRAVTGVHGKTTPSPAKMKSPAPKPNRQKPDQSKPSPMKVTPSKPKKKKTIGRKPAKTQKKKVTKARRGRKPSKMAKGVRKPNSR